MPEHVFLSKTERSYIDVILKDGTYHHFTPRVLDVLLESHRVYKFKRSSGWTTIGIDPVRTKKSGVANHSYTDGNDRRMMIH
jgi:hypothetical protein